jgi:predicted component of type VI protein secretion system
MLTLEIHAPGAAVSRHRFDAEGGDIGRAPGNQLVLKDPDRRVSRTHARIVKRNQGPRIICLSAAGLTLNNQLVELGEEALIEDQAQIGIGDFLLRALRADHA